MLSLAFLTCHLARKPAAVTDCGRRCSKYGLLKQAIWVPRRRFPLSAAVAAVLGLLAQPAQSQTSAAASVEFSAARTAIKNAHFAEPLVPTAATTPLEDAALAQAVTAWERRTSPDDFSSLTNFLSAHASSGWSAAVLTNLGLTYLHYGYFSRALEAWRQAWIEGGKAAEPDAKAMVDGVIGERARLYASLGQFDHLQALFDEIGNRPISGSATEAVQAARETLQLSRKDPRHLYICGPRAVASLLLARGVGAGKARALEFYRAAANGTSLATVSRLAAENDIANRLIFRRPGQALPRQAIVHWKVGHFAAIIGAANGRVHVADPVFAAQDLWVTPAAIDAEASGYFLIPDDIKMAAGWRLVGRAEAAKIWGKGPTNRTQPWTPYDRRAAPPRRPPCPLCEYNISESSVSLTLADQPVGYAPPIGPSAVASITYSQREESQPQNFSFFNLGQKWTLGWLSYVTDDPGNPGGSVSRYLSGGGALSYSGYNSATGQFAPEDVSGSVLVLSSQSPVTYRLESSDGSVDIYARSDGSPAYPRNIFLTDRIDPQGNALHFTYDSQLRLMTVTDGAGRQTALSYGLQDRPLAVTKITDPFGRSAALTYDAFGRLTSIIDVIGLKSSFTYDLNSLVNALITPYGTTSFTYTTPGASGPPRFLEAVDPLGYHEREEWAEPAPIPTSDPASTVPAGMPLAPTNQYLEYRDSFHWDRDQYVAAGCTPTGGCDYTKARDTHFLHLDGNTKSTTVESVKQPLENRVWFQYPGQTSTNFVGIYDQPVAIGRVLDDGTTQLTKVSYDTAGYYKPTQTIDPLGRTTSFVYLNKVDLSAINQATGNGGQATIAQFAYNSHHRVLAYVDAAGQLTSYSYNAAGQLLSQTDALGYITKYGYNPTGDLLQVTNANGVGAGSYTYDAFDRVATYTDSEGWMATYSYDAADRLTKTLYPDGTAELYTYDRLDMVAFRDRLGRTWRYGYDADSNLTSVTDPAGKQALLAYNREGRLKTLTDPNNHATNWTYDIEGRVTLKQYADLSTLTYTYETTTSRLKSVKDALNQTKQLSYTLDDQISGISYLNAVHTTPNVTFAYNSYFPNLATMTDGNGLTSYTYVPVGTPGALQVQTETSPLANSAITYAYDALGRARSRSAAGEGAETSQYDALGRLTGHNSDLGSFTLTYLGQTGQLSQRSLASSTLKTVWSYLPNSGDRRLSEVDNTGLSAAQFSNFAITSEPGTTIDGVTETSDAATVYPSPATQSASYNNMNQLTNLSGTTLTYDADGNLTSDGVRSYTWDAENRLASIGYTGQTGKLTAFAYDGLGRRTTIASTPAGGGTATTISYLWCGSQPCQARSAANVVAREYLAEGEYVPGSPGQPYYYGVDQIGSVRRVFVNPTSAPAYAYDPYGNPLQITAPLTDYGFGGMFRDADSGLGLTRYRTYSPVNGNWMSRDPLGERTGQGTNLYAYVAGDPVSVVDPLGLICSPGYRWPGLRGPAGAPGRGAGPGGSGGPGGPGRRGSGISGRDILLGAAIIGTEIIGGGPEDPLADIAVAEEIELFGSDAFSTYDTSAGLKAIATDVTPDEFVENLESNGYTSRTVNSSNGSTTVLTNGDSTYSVYTRSSTGETGASYTNSSGQTIKYDFGPGK